MNPTEARAAAVKLIREQQGLSALPPSSWSYEQRVAYNTALANYIATNPTKFTQQDLTTSADVLSSVASPLADTSIVADLSTFGGAFADEVLAAGDKVADVGRGTLDAVSIVGKLLPVVAVIAVALVVYAGVRKAREA